MPVRCNDDSSSSSSSPSPSSSSSSFCCCCSRPIGEGKRISVERGFDRYSITYQAFQKRAEVSLSADMSELSGASPEICKTLQTENPARTAEGPNGNPNTQKSLECLHAWAWPLIILGLCFFVVVAELLSSLEFCSFGSCNWSITLLGQFIIV